MIRMGVSGWKFLLVPAYPGCPGSKAVKRSLLLLLLSMLSKRSLRDETLKNRCRIVFKLAHSRSMWLTVSGRLQNWHVAVSRCKCVRRVWPIRSLLMTTASLRDRNSEQQTTWTSIQQSTSSRSTRAETSGVAGTRLCCCSRQTDNSISFSTLTIHAAKTINCELYVMTSVIN